VRALDRAGPALARLARTERPERDGRHERAARRASPEGPSARVEVLEGDVRDRRLLSAALSGVDAVVHLAALVPPLTEQEPSLAESINVGATLELVRLAERAGSSPRFVYPSSVVVYGPSPPDERPTPRGAGDPVVATDRYSAHKLACESILRASSLPFVALRLGVVLRPRDQKVSRASLAAMRRVHPDTPIELLHPADAADAMLAAVRLASSESHVVSVGGGPGLRLRHRDLWAMLLSAAGLAPPPDALFGREPYYTSWLSSEGHRLLGHATRDREALMATWRDELAAVRPLGALARPLVRAALGRSGAGPERA
jgi:nucleoside-diphosphate-sugar epimerase